MRALYKHANRDNEALQTGGLKRDNILAGTDLDDDEDDNARFFKTLIRMEQDRLATEAQFTAFMTKLDERLDAIDQARAETLRKIDDLRERAESAYGGEDLYYDEESGQFYNAQTGQFLSAEQSAGLTPDKNAPGYQEWLALQNELQAINDYEQTVQTTQAEIEEAQENGTLTESEIEAAEQALDENVPESVRRANGAGAQVPDAQASPDPVETLGLTADELAGMAEMPGTTDLPGDPAASAKSVSSVQAFNDTVTGPPDAPPETPQPVTPPVVRAGGYDTV